MLDTALVKKEISPDIIDCLYKKSWEILSYLKANNHRIPPVTAKDIQEVFHIDGSTASNHLSRLEKLGLIKRERRGKNKYIYITELGEYFVP